MKGHQKYKAVIYARVSSVQQKTQGHGLTSQQTRCAEFARSKGYEVVEVFFDDMTGKVTKRPGMTAMLAFLKRSKETHVVIVDDISRLARSVKTHLILRNSISKAGGRLETPSIQFADDDDPDTLFFENIQAASAQHQAEKNGQNARNRTRSRALEGYWAWNAPLGLRFARVPGHGNLLVPDGAVAEVVKEALLGYASGRFETLSEVMRFLDKHPAYPEVRRRQLRVERVRELLERPIYAGYVDMPAWGLHMIPGKHEALISFATFQTIQDRLQGKAKAPATPSLSEAFPLRGAVCCSACGNRLTSCFSKGRSKLYGYYVCVNRRCYSKGKSVRQEVMEQEFEDILRRLTPSANLMALAHAMFSDLWHGRIAAAKAKAAAIEAELRKADKSIGQYLDRIAETTTPTLIDAYEQRIRELSKRKAELREEVVVEASPKGTFDEVYRTALMFLSNPWKLWQSERIEDKRGVLKAVLAEPLTYVRGEGYRNPKTSAPFGFMAALHEGCRMVDATGIEPVTPTMSTPRMRCF